MGAHHHSSLTVKLALVAVFLADAAWPAGGAPIDSSLSTKDKRQLQREARLVVDLLQNYHYSGRSFREIESKEMVTRFLEELDPGDDFLTADDIDFLHARFDRTFKTVYLLRGDLQPAFEIFDLFATRAHSRHLWIEQRLKRGFDFSLDEEYVENRRTDSSKNTQPADRRWELRLKEQVLREILAGRESAEAAAVVGKRYDEMRRQIAAVDSLVVRERFFDALIRSFDPHSGYFSADSAREFAEGMANAVAGIGLELHKENGLCVVATVQPGGPADLQSDIQAGDIVDELAGENLPVLDAARTPLRELVARVRGQPGTKLQLTYHADGSARRDAVTLERSRVLLGAERARGAISVVPTPGGGWRRIGWITLPAFYAGGEGPTATSATLDVRELLGQMTTKGIDGLALDLRGNPGGTLPEAVALSEVFLNRGRVVISRNLDGSVVGHDMVEGKRAYAGPLVLLTSPQSASASEVFAGTMKFHQRAVIVGGAATFGKGTVQNYIELAKTQPSLAASETTNWGTLRLTYQRFYLPDGKTVQREGIPSDIVLPDYRPDPQSREADLPHALAAESITPPGNAPAPDTDRVVTSEPLLRHLRERAEIAVGQLPEWKLWRREQVVWQAVRDRRTYSLQLDTRRSELDKTLADYAAMWRARRQLTAQAAFIMEPLEIPLMQPALAAHEAKLRAARGDDGQPLLQRLHHGSFTVETDGGRLRQLRLQAIDFTAFFGEPDALAAAFTSGAGQTVAAPVVRRMLQDFSLLEHKTDEALLAVVAQAAGGTLDQAAVRRGTEALLGRLVEIDGDMCRARPGLDVPLRECLRLAAAWADWPAGAQPQSTAP